MQNCHYGRGMVNTPMQPLGRLQEIKIEWQRDVEILIAELQTRQCVECHVGQDDDVFREAEPCIHWWKNGNELRWRTPSRSQASVTTYYRVRKSCCVVDSSRHKICTTQNSRRVIASSMICYEFQSRTAAIDGHRRWGRPRRPCTPRRWLRRGRKNSGARLDEEEKHVTQTWVHGKSLR